MKREDLEKANKFVAEIELLEDDLKQNKKALTALKKHCENDTSLKITLTMELGNAGNQEIRIDSSRLKIRLDAQNSEIADEIKKLEEELENL